MENPKTRLIDAIDTYPSEWAITPVRADKRPFRKDWQNEPPLRKEDLLFAVQRGPARGFGLRTGPVSGGIVAIDCDGEAAHQLAAVLGGLPFTVSFTSGKPGRAQYLYSIPEILWRAVKTRKLQTGTRGELLELRWDGCQSVLPPSEHPETGLYLWINSPETTAIAPAPEWVIEKMRGDDPKSAPPRERPSLPLYNDREGMSSIYDDIPLIVALSRQSRSLIDGGAPDGTRDDSGAALARDLIGTKNRLPDLGYRCTANPRDYFEQFADRCNPPLDQKSRDRIWRSAEKKNPSPSMSDDYIKNCIAAHLKKDNSKVVSLSLYNDTESPYDETPEILQEWAKLRSAVGDRLSFNVLSQKPEIDGEPIDMEYPELDIAKHFNLSIKGSERRKDALILDVAKSNSHNPFEDFLNRCHSMYSDTTVLDGLAAKYFGATDPIHQIQVRRFLIGIVARTKQPGCKNEAVLILNSQNQGIGKSTWLRKLVGDRYFCDDMGDFSRKDELLKAHNSVLLEWAELETIVGRKMNSQTKAFLSGQTDKIRPPYARRAQEMPRRFAIAGTTNEPDILTDPTGSRRFWVIPVNQAIPTHLLDEERDRIWGAAVELYQQGEQWWLTPEEQNQSNLANEQFTEQSLIDEFVEDFVSDKDEVTSEEVRFYLESKNVQAVTFSDVRAAGRIIKTSLTKLGWHKERLYRDGKRPWGYRRSGIPTDPLIHQRSIDGSLMDRNETPAPTDFQPTDPSDPSKTDISVNFSPTPPASKTDSAIAPEPTAPPPPEPKERCTTIQDAIEACKRILREEWLNGRRSVRRSLLVERFEDPTAADGALKKLRDRWLIEEKNGYIAPIGPSKRKKWFATGAQIQILRDGHYSAIGTVVRLQGEESIVVKADNQEILLLLSDVRPYPKK